LRQLPVSPLRDDAMLVCPASPRKAHRHLKSEQMKTAEGAKDAEEKLQDSSTSSSDFFKKCSSAPPCPLWFLFGFRHPKRVLPQRCPPLRQ
jgi:hypothetical protein